MLRQAIIAATLGLTLSGCDDLATRDVNAPGEWFWFKLAPPAEREAYYATQCAGDRGCITNAIRQQALQTCRIYALDRNRDENWKGGVEEYREDQRYCADQYMIEHGLRL